MHIIQCALCLLLSFTLCSQNNLPLRQYDCTWSCPNDIFGCLPATRYQLDKPHLFVSGYGAPRFHLQFKVSACVSA
jgi:hypothetical protein